MTATSPSSEQEEPVLPPDFGPMSVPAISFDEPSDVVDRSIGDFLRQTRNLTDAHIEQILRYQRKRGLRFGEAAIALRLVSREDVLWALSQQFHYPYVPDNAKGLSPELVAAVDPLNEQSESLRGIRSQLLLDLMAPDQPRRALSVISPNVGDGKSFFAANLAIVFSQLGGRTLLVDADMRTPRQHELFSIPNREGLSGILSGRRQPEIIHQVKNLPSLFVMPVGTIPPNPLELLQRPSFSQLIREVLTKFDYVLVDTPAGTYGADNRVLAAKCGVSLAIGRRGRSRMAAMQSLVKDVTRGPSKFAGVVINDH